MLSGFLLALREGIEAAIVIGILLGALRKLQRTDLSSRVWTGALAAFVTSALVAVGLQIAGASLGGAAEQIFEGITMLLAAVLLTWMIFWMQRQSRSLRGKIELEARRAANDATGRWSLFGVAFLAVVREGVELALFLIAAGFNANPVSTLSGAALGLISAALLGWLYFTSTRRLPMQRFFQVTNILLILFAAGLVAHGVHEFNEVGWLPAVVEHLYDVNLLLDEKSVVGQLFMALFGYNGNPSLTETLAYITYFLVLLLSTLRFQRRVAIEAASQP